MGSVEQRQLLADVYALIGTAIANAECVGGTRACMHVTRAREIEDRIAAALREQPEARGVVLNVKQVGNYGAAYDSPGTCRAFTYDHQPGNVDASRLGGAVVAAANASAGDSIDRGLALLKALREIGFGVFQITAAQQPGQEGGGEPVEHDECPVCENNRRFCANCGSTGFVPATAPPSAPVGLDPPVERQRDLLAQAIRDAAVKAGIARADADMTGPMLLMLCDDMADCILTQQPAQAAPGDARAIIEEFVQCAGVGRPPGKLIAQAQDWLASPSAPVGVEEGACPECGSTDKVEDVNGVLVCGNNFCDSEPWKHPEYEARKREPPTPPGDDAAGGGHG